MLIPFCGFNFTHRLDAFHDLVNVFAVFRKTHKRKCLKELVDAIHIHSAALVPFFDGQLNPSVDDIHEKRDVKAIDRPKTSHPVEPMESVSESSSHSSTTSERKIRQTRMGQNGLVFLEILVDDDTQSIPESPKRWQVSSAYRVEVRLV